MVTIKDIAKEAGVSYATVSRALNNVKGTKDSTSKRIKALAKQMGYQRNVLAAGLVTKRTDTIGFILPEIGNPFFVKILSAISEIADQNNYTVLICNTGWDLEKEREELQTLSERRVDGILLYPSSEIDRFDDRLSLVDVPLVLYGEAAEITEMKRRAVIVDNVLAGRIAMEHMLECGYKKFAYLGGPQKSSSSVARLEGIRKVAVERKLKLNEADISEEKYTIESGYASCKTMLERPKNRRPDAFICANDLIALGALQAVSESGMKVGGEIGVMGFDDVQYAALPQIQLTSVRIPCEEMGEIGMHLLLQLINDEEETEKEHFVRTMQPELIVRKTTRGER